jgi:branched-chain amino acid transport system substrate-binding protein
MSKEDAAKGKITKFWEEITKSLVTYVQSSSANLKRNFFKIGVLTSLTGHWTKGGYSTKRGYDIWAERVNSEGGIKIDDKRYPVELIYYDTQSDPEIGGKVAESLIAEEDVDFIFGPYSSAMTLAVAPIIEQYKVPHITGSAESVEILKRGFEWTFGVLLASPSVMDPPLRLLKYQLDPGLQTAAIIGADDVFSKSMAEDFLRAALELGFKIKHYEFYPVNCQNLASFICKVKARSPEVFIVSGHVDNLIEAVRTSKALGFHPQAYVMHYGVASQDFVDVLGKDAKHILGVSQWSPEANYKGPVFGTAKEFHDLFVARYNREPDHIEAGSAAAGVIFQQLIERSGLKPPPGPKDKLLLREILWELEFETFFGPISFSERIPKGRGGDNM